MKSRKLTPVRIVGGVVCILLSVLVLRLDISKSIAQMINLVALLGACICFFPANRTTQTNKTPKKISRRTWISLLFTLIAVPLTICFGTFYLENRKYYFISLLVIAETLIPFFFSYESKKPRARELIIISVLCALAVAGRVAFAFLPFVKPSLAIVILSAIAFGGETGFLTGSITAFVSNFYFSHGPWTPWQMIAFGFVGLLAGIVFRFLPKNRIFVSIYGFLATVLIYGVIADISALLQYMPNPTLQALKDTLALGFPFNLIHAISTACFLWVLTDPISEKLDRVKSKYGLSLS